LEMLQWARANGCPWDEGTCAAFARGGNLEMLQWARANGCPWDEGTCAAAARGGHLEVLKYAGQTDARGMKGRARRPRGEVIWRYCNGPEQTDALGMLGW
jgi:hypothetical protein